MIIRRPEAKTASFCHAKGGGVNEPGCGTGTFCPGEIPKRYEQLWSELTREETFGPHERFRIDARLRGLAELGFDVEEVELIASESGYRLRFNPQVVEPGHHSRRLTGIDAQENRARRLLHDIAGFRAQPGNGLPLQESAIAARWLAEVYEPALAAIPAELRGKLQPAEAFHQILEHRWFLSEAQRRDVGMETAAASYAENVLHAAPAARSVLEPDD